LVNWADPITEIVARKIIEIAGMGERDPERIFSVLNLALMVTFGTRAISLPGLNCRRLTNGRSLQRAARLPRVRDYLRGLALAEPTAIA
jgi:hypothetical protein